MSLKTEKIILILLLGGSGSRFNSRIPKQYLRLNHHAHPLFIETILNLSKNIPINDIVLVGNPEYMTEDEFLHPIQVIKENQPETTIHVISGGKTRHESFLQGAELACKYYQSGIVLVHDANRPHITLEFSYDIKKALEKTSENKPCFIPVIASTDSLCLSSESKVYEYLPRQKIQKIQTPQILNLASMKSAIEKKQQAEESKDYTDEGSFMLDMGFAVYTYPGSNSNMKITYPEDK